MCVSNHKLVICRFICIFKKKTVYWISFTLRLSLVAAEMSDLQSNHLPLENIA